MKTALQKMKNRQTFQWNFSKRKIFVWKRFVRKYLKLEFATYKDVSETFQLLSFIITILQRIIIMKVRITENIIQKKKDKMEVE